MILTTREDPPENVKEQKKERKDYLKKGKEKMDASMTGKEAKHSFVSRRSFGDSFSQKTESVDQPIKPLASTIASTVSRLKKQVELYRTSYVKARMESNNEKLQAYTSKLLELSEERTIDAGGEAGSEAKDLLSLQIQKAVHKLPGLDASMLEKEGPMSQEEGLSTFLSLVSGNVQGAKNAVRPVKLPAIQKYPPYTTWIFLDRNQKMPEDQSVVGRRRIYYDQNRSEALICSDSEEEQVDDEDEKHEFSKGEDYILWKAIQELGLSEPLLKSLGNYIDATPDEVEARYELLEKESSTSCDFLAHERPYGEPNVGETLNAGERAAVEDDCEMLESQSTLTEENNCDDKDLDAAMDSFDNLFCRRCLVFDCRLHGCSQTVIQPSEKQQPWSNPEGGSTPCGPECHLLGFSQENQESVHSTLIIARKNSLESQMVVSPQQRGTEFVHADVVEQSLKVENEKAIEDAETLPQSTTDAEETPKLERPRKGKKLKKSPKRRAEEVLENIRKKQSKVAASDPENKANSPSSPKTDSGKLKVHERLSQTKDTLRAAWKKASKALPLPVGNKSMKRPDKGAIQVQSESNIEGSDMKIAGKNWKILMGASHVDTQLSSEQTVGNVLGDAKSGNSVESKWSKLERGLYEKGLDIFGKSSCLIARNMLKGLKTCREVAEYIAYHELAAQCKLGDGIHSHLHGSGKASERDDTVDLDVRTRTRFWRRRGRVRRLKYTWKSAGHPAIKKRVVDSKDQPCRQYTPCNCQFMCGKQCSCLHSGTCCEKYCGCSKSCKNRFRGCHCAKSQCRSRQCPCFAAGRECDPDVCRNCWVGCGDGTLGGPPQRGDNYECQNMKLLLRQQQRVLLGRSDVAGWGAFLKNSVSRHDYLGEYTGELISHREADKRGKIYDRENSSFLFNLNDQYVLDAYRKGDKLKFANHSPNPNCYAKVIMVAGDHRVGIFAKDRISAGEELFYDYRYEPDRAPVWAKKPEGTHTKRDEVAVTGGRAQKVA